MAQQDRLPGGGATPLDAGVQPRLGDSAQPGDALPEETMSLDEALRLAAEYGLTVTPGANGQIWFRKGDLVV